MQSSSASTSSIWTEAGHSTGRRSQRSRKGSERSRTGSGTHLANKLMGKPLSTEALDMLPCLKCELY